MARSKQTHRKTPKATVSHGSKLIKLYGTIHTEHLVKTHVFHKLQNLPTDDLPKYLIPKQRLQNFLEDKPTRESIENIHMAKYDRSRQHPLTNRLVQDIIDKMTTEDKTLIIQEYQSL